MGRKALIQLAALVLFFVASGPAPVLTQAPSTSALAPVKAADYGKWETLGGAVLADNGQLELEVVGDNARHSFRAQITLDTRDNAFLPTEGWLLEAGFEQTIGTFEYPRGDFDIRKYFLLRQRPDGSGRPLGERGRDRALRAAENVDEDLAGVQAPQLTGAKHGGQDLLRLGAGRGAVAAPDLAEDDAEANGQLGPPVGGVQARKLEKS